MYPVQEDLNMILELDLEGEPDWLSVIDLRVLPAMLLFDEGCYYYHDVLSRKQCYIPNMVKQGRSSIVDQLL